MQFWLSHWHINSLDSNYLKHYVQFSFKSLITIHNVDQKLTYKCPCSAHMPLSCRVAHVRIHPGTTCAPSNFQPRTHTFGVNSKFWIDNYNTPLHLRISACINIHPDRRSVKSEKEIPTFFKIRHILLH